MRAMPKQPVMPSRVVTVQDVIDEGTKRNIAFTSEQAEAISIATTSLLESAARLRGAVSRNDEPAFGFRLPLPDLGRP